MQKKKKTKQDFRLSFSTFRRWEKLDFPSDTDIRDLGTGNKATQRESWAG